MAQTLASSTALLCPVDEFLKRVDRAAVAKLASDDAQGKPVILTALPTDPNVIAALRDAGGWFETAVSRGRRYELADIAVVLASDTNARGILYRIVADLGWFFLFQRRPNKDVPAPPSLEYSLKLMDELGDGKKVFPFLESEAAGVMQVVETNVDDVEARNGAVYQARAFYGRTSERDRGGWRT
jgi:hypothetical protein